MEDSFFAEVGLAARVLDQSRLADRISAACLGYNLPEGLALRGDWESHNLGELDSLQEEPSEAGVEN